jgi:hypothetical protein
MPKVPLSRFIFLLSLVPLIAGLSGCLSSPRVDLRTTHPERASLLGRFRTTRPLYGYRQESGERIHLGNSITTPFDIHGRPHPIPPDYTFPAGTRVQVTGIEKDVTPLNPDMTLLTGKIVSLEGRWYPMEYIAGFPDPLPTPWR